MGCPSFVFLSAWLASSRSHVSYLLCCLQCVYCHLALRVCAICHLETERTTALKSDRKKEEHCLLGHHLCEVPKCLASRCQMGRRPNVPPAPPPQRKHQPGNSDLETEREPAMAVVAVDVPQLRVIDCFDLRDCYETAQDARSTLTWFSFVAMTSRLNSFQISSM